MPKKGPLILDQVLPLATGTTLTFKDFFAFPTQERKGYKSTYIKRQKKTKLHGQ